MVNRRRFYVPELDGLRFLAFLFVFCSHALPSTETWWKDQGVTAPKYLIAAVKAGAFGVDLFFVLSSFLITELLLRERETTGELNIKAFWIRRALRIWPLQMVFLAIAYLCNLTVPEPAVTLSTTACFLLFVGNWRCAIFGYPPSVIAPLWSISLEEQFYLVWPLFVSRLSIKAIKLSAIGLVIIGEGFRAMVASCNFGHPMIWCSTFSRLDSIGAGILLALYLRRAESSEQLQAPGWLKIAILGATWTTCWLLPEALWPLENQGVARVLLGYPAVSLGATIFIYLGMSCRPLRTPILVHLGKISYGLYVTHSFAIFAARQLLGLTAIPSILVAFIINLMLAEVSYRLLETPFLSLKERFTSVLSRPV